MRCVENLVGSRILLLTAVFVLSSSSAAADATLHAILERRWDLVIDLTNDPASTVAAFRRSVAFKLPSATTCAVVAPTVGTHRWIMGRCRVLRAARFRCRAPRCVGA